MRCGGSAVHEHVPTARKGVITGCACLLFSASVRAFNALASNDFSAERKRCS